MEYEKQTIHIFESTSIHPTRIQEFKPLKHTSKSLEEITQALSEIPDLQFKGEEISGIYQCTTLNQSCIVHLTDHYEDNAQQRKERKRVLHVVNHGVRANILYDQKHIHIRQLDMIENILREQYKYTA